MEKGTWSLFPCAPDGLRRVREAVLVTRQKTPTHRPQQSLSKRRETKGPRNVPCALVTRPVLDGGLRGRCAR